MPYYKLVASGHPEVVVNKLIFSEDKTLSTNEPVELSEEEFTNAKDLAASVGYRLAEVGEPRAEEESESQETGSDVAGMSPVVTEGDTGPEIDQQAEEDLEQSVGSRGAQGDQVGSETSGTTGVSDTGGNIQTNTL